MTERTFETTGALDVQEEIDLDQCHNDPIHRTALIMPHGAFLKLTTDELRIETVSNNADDFFPASTDELLGCTLAEGLGLEWETAVDDRMPVGRIKREFVFQPGDTRCLVSVFPMGQDVGMEVQHAYPVGNSSEETMVDLRHYLSELKQYSNRGRLYDRIVQGIRSVTEYDRVMLYRFNPEGHGTVVAEDKQDELHSYLKQQFPASDIPEPARRLYRLNDIRYIPTIDYEPVPLVDEGGTHTVDELDLTYSDLRNVPLVHREYLANMDVRGSLSVPVVIDRNLWGLIACHGQTDHSIDWPRRDLARMIGGSASQQIARLDAEERSRQRESITSFREDLEQGSSATDELPEIIKRYQDRILSFLDSNRFYLRLDGRECWFSKGDGGDVPRSLLEEISERLEDQDIVDIRSIEREINEDWDRSTQVSGLLAIRLGRQPDSFCVWFRPEHRETIRWGGDPRHPVDVDEEGRISPRNSFEEWKQIVSGQCEQWSELDRMTVRELVRFFEKQAIEQQSRKLSEYNEELQSQNKKLRQTRERLVTANRKKEDLMDELQHRVKNNFQLVTSILRLKQREIESDEAKRIIKNIERRLQSMATLHKKLYENEDGTDVELSGYFRDLIDVIQESFRDEFTEATITPDLAEITLSSDRAIIAGIVLTELLTNSFEHGFGSESDTGGTIRVILEREDGEGLHLVVADNGRGFDGDPADVMTASLGLQLIQSLVNDQLRGSIEVSEEDGARFDVRFPLD